MNWIVVLAWVTQKAEPVNKHTGKWVIWEMIPWKVRRAEGN